MRTIGFILSLGLLIGSVSAAGSADRGALHAGLFTYNGASIEAPIQIAQVQAK